MKTYREILDGAGFNDEIDGEIPSRGDVYRLGQIEGLQAALAAIASLSVKSTWLPYVDGYARAKKDMRDAIDDLIGDASSPSKREATVPDGMDMTPEGYVREWVKRGRRNPLTVPAWEDVYQEGGMISEAQRLGYLHIGTAVSCPVTLTEKGEVLIKDAS